MEDTLIKDGIFALSGCKSLFKDDSDYALFLIDATESSIERPKKQCLYYFGKKKQHTKKKNRLITNEYTLSTNVQCLGMRSDLI
jgi:hypothetical protein